MVGDPFESVVHIISSNIFFKMGHTSFDGLIYILWTTFIVGWWFFYIPLYLIFYINPEISCKSTKRNIIFKALVAHLFLMFLWLIRVLYIKSYKYHNIWIVDVDIFKAIDLTLPALTYVYGIWVNLNLHVEGCNALSSDRRIRHRKQKEHHIILIVSSIIAIIKYPIHFLSDDVYFGDMAMILLNAMFWLSISYFPHFAGIILGQFREAGQPAMRSHTFA